MKPQDITEFNCTSITTDGAKESLYWLPIEELDNYKVFPKFFKDKLKNSDVGVQHVITKQNKDIT